MRTFASIVLLFSVLCINGQNIDKDIFCKKEWRATKANHDIKTKKDSLAFTLLLVTADATSYKFNEDGSFDWDDNPSCGTNAYKTSGKGSWKYENKILILDFKNVMTEQRGKRLVEKYKILELNKEKMILQRS